MALVYTYRTKTDLLVSKTLHVITFTFFYVFFKIPKNVTFTFFCFVACTFSRTLALPASARTFRRSDVPGVSTAAENTAV